MFANNSGYIGVFKRIPNILLVLLLLSNGASYAQNHNTTGDSLLAKAKRVYKTNPKSGLDLADRARSNARKAGNKIGEVKSLNLIVTIFWTMRDYAKAGDFAHQSSSIARQTGVDSLIGDSWVLIGAIDYAKNNYGSAIVNYQRAIGSFTKAKMTHRLAITYRNLGLCENKLARFEIANDFYFKAAEIFSRSGMSKELADTYNSIGLCFQALANLKQAIYYNKQALNIRQKLKISLSIAQSYNNIGFAFKELDQPDSAIVYLSNSVALYQIGRDSDLLVLPLQNLGSSWKKKGDLKKAGSYVLRSLGIATKYAMKEELARGNLDLAEIYIVQKKYPQALAAIRLTESTAKKMHLPELLMDTYADEFSLYEEEGDYKRAILYDNDRNKIKDSLFTAAKNRAIDELEIKYQASQKEKDITALHLQNSLQNKIVKQQTQSIFILIVAAILLMLLLVIAYYNYRSKNIANQRIKTLMQDLHHRVKNNLSILSGLLAMQLTDISDVQMRGKLLDNEARLNAMNLVHNKLYLNDKDTRVEIKGYLTELINQVKISFGGDERNIVIRADMDELWLQADQAVAIGLLINELATNAFKYAFGAKGGELFIGLKTDGKKLHLILGDNGKGFKGKSTARGASFGLKLVRLLAQQLGAELLVSEDNGIQYQMEINI
ncbi:MAG TPA: tetratricopeptide repeat protein [Mucilaginibacter sp.]|nr:tetratricopeptide repeat protein [Mucilaginibacter sp.]